MILVLILDQKENITDNWQNLNKSYNLNTLYQVMFFKKKKISILYIDEIYILIIWVSQVAVVKNPPANGEDTEDMDLIPGSGKFPGGGDGNPLQYSCLENPMDRGAWWSHKPLKICEWHYSLTIQNKCVKKFYFRRHVKVNIFFRTSFKT